MSKVIAVIPARGGSKRIPKKNIRNFMGKPVISYAIEAAIKSNIFDEIMVSTDSLEIAHTSEEYGAKVPFMRSEKTADDYATTYAVLEEVILNYKKEGQVFDNICCIFPCSPFLTPDTLSMAYQRMKDKQVANAILPVCQYPVPIEWAMNIEEEYVHPINRDSLDIRSQEFIPKYFDVGMFYFCKIESMFKHKSLVPNNTLGYIIDNLQCQDIDTEKDWKEAEFKYSLFIKTNF